MPKASDYQSELPPAFVQRGQAAAATGTLVPTPPDILGPFYRPGSPHRKRLVDGHDDVQLILTGKVTDTRGRPVDGYIEFWQADEHGRYDVDGSNFRGIQRLQDGRYEVGTVVPGCYDISEPGDPEPHVFRCPHIHVKVWVGGRDVLTTQLYFPNEKYNDTDRWFDPHRVIKLFSDSESSADRGEFDVVVSLH